MFKPMTRLEIALRVAREACPHWDYEGESEVQHDCCLRAAEARQEVIEIRNAERRGNTYA